MTNVRTIHVDWYNQRPLRSNGGPQLAFQGDHLSNMVVFDNAPELPNYYLLVEMKTDDAGIVDTLPAIQLEGPYWVIPNYYTQICQQITFQVCCKTETGDYEHHSAKFKGTILPVLKHNGEPIDQSPMFDPYIDILDKRVNELIITAGDIQIDSELKSDSGNPVQNRVVKAAVDGLGNDVDAVNGRLQQDEEDILELQNGGYVADQQQIGQKINAWLTDHPEATTTVQDGSLTESKFSDALELKTIKDYVTPEMYGAKGDGSTDDTTAIQSAINSGKPVVLLNKTYRTNTKITVSDGCPTIRSYGLIKYYGNDYALEFVACRNKTYHLGRIESSAGGCVLLDSSNGYIQYLNFYFVNFKALTNCVYAKIPSSWINEIRFFNGMLSSGNYGVYAENSTATPKNHYIFSEIGFEGVTTGIYLAGAFSNVACYGCRMEESTTNLLETDASTLSNSNSFLWYGLLRMGFTNNAKSFPIYCVGPIYNTDGALISYKGVIVDGLFYGDLAQGQYYLGRWNAENPVKTITNANVVLNGTVFRYYTVNLEQECVIEIEKTAFYLSANFNMPIYILGDIAANHTLIVRTTDGVTLATYTPTSDVYNRLIKIHYLSNWGIVLQEMPKMTRIQV